MKSPVAVRGGHLGAVALEPVDAGAHVLRTGDGRHAPAAAVEEVADGLAGAVFVLDVDAGHGARRHQAAVADHRHAGAAEPFGQRVGAVHGEDDHAVDVAAGGVALHPVVARTGRADHHQHELLLGALQLEADAADDAGEERVVGEDAAGGLRGDQCDRVGPLGHEAARGQVRHVAERFDGGEDLVADLRRHRGGAPHHPGCRRAGNAGPLCDIFQRGPLTARQSHPPIMNYNRQAAKQVASPPVTPSHRDTLRSPPGATGRALSTFDPASYAGWDAVKAADRFRFGS